MAISATFLSYRAGTIVVHQSKSDSVMFSFSDRPVQEKLGIVARTARVTGA